MTGDIVGVKEAAVILGVSEAMVRRMVRRRNFRVIRRKPLLLSRRILEASLKRRAEYAAAMDGLDRWVSQEPEYQI